MVGLINNSPGPSVTAPPRLFISLANADSRSVSCKRRCPIPLRFVGELARDAKAAIAGVNSPTSCKSISIQVISPFPETFNPLGVNSIFAPICAKILRN